MRLVKLVLMYALVYFVAGCASNVRQDVIQPVANVPAGKVQNIYLVVSAPPSVTSETAYTDSVAELRDAIADKLRPIMPTARLVSGDAPPASGIKANLIIEDYRYVHGAARFWTGVIIGKARLGVRVELFDLATGKKIGESVFGTSSKTSEGILGGTTSRQIDAVADSIAKMLSDALR